MTFLFFVLSNLTTTQVSLSRALLSATVQLCVKLRSLTFRLCGRIIVTSSTDCNHNHRPCRWFAQAPLGPITSRTYRFIESSFYCMMRPTAIEIAAWRILLFVSPWLSVFLNHTLSPAFQTCSSLRSDIFSGHS